MGKVLTNNMNSSTCISLGITDHDGDGNATACPNDQQYIMASSRRGITENNFDNVYRFSSCSIRELREKLLLKSQK